METIHPSKQALPCAATLLFFALLIADYSAVFAQAKLVKDLNISPYRHFNEYTQLTNAGDHFYFVSNGNELWRSDGTSAGTKRVKTIRKIENLTFVNNTLYFAGTDVSGSELWKSDGTPSGTVRLRDIRKGLASSSPRSFKRVNETVFFIVNHNTGYQLWKTNGTSTGTVLVKEISKGLPYNEPSYLTAVNDILYFSADDGIHGSELWKSDGTAAGTIMVKDIQPFEGESSEPRELVELNGFVFFSAYHSLSGNELWRSDGTAQGTIRLKDINPGDASSEIGPIRRMGNAIYFHAHNGNSGTALWRSSGTTAGTVMLKDLTSDASRWEVFDMTVLNNRIYWIFEGNVWASNGTAAGTRIAAPSNSGTPARFTAVNKKVYYFSREWSEDPYGPLHQLNSINPDGSGWDKIWEMFTPFTVGGEEDEYWYDYRLELLAFNNALFFPGIRNEVEDYKFLKSNGTHTPPTLLIDTYRPTEGSCPNTMLKNNNHIFFATNDHQWDNTQLWRSDGTKSGTIRLTTNWAIDNLISMNSTVFFTTRTNGFQLWKTDGTIAGTILLKEQQVEDFDLITGIIKSGNRLFFKTDRGGLWTSDGTAAGTVLLKDFLYVEHVGVLGNIAYAVVISSTGSQEVWKSNGTPAGTTKVRTLRASGGPSTSTLTASIGHVSYFVGHDGIHGHELWRTDGTASGTFMVKDILPGENEMHSVDITELIAFNNALYINAKDPNGDMALFKSDGTNAGTKKIYDSKRILKFIPYEDHLLFVAQEFGNLELWSTDGTTAGTVHLHAIPHMTDGSISHVELNGIVYLAYQNSMLIWRTDGTACGTFGIDVGLTEMNNLASLGDNLLFSGKNRLYGNELFAFSVANVSIPECPEGLAAREQAHPTSEEGEIKNVLYSPNPFTLDIAVTVKSDQQSTAQVSVFDMAGHPVMSETLETNKSHRVGTNWKEGFYIMRIISDGKTSYTRLIKGH